MRQPHLFLVPTVSLLALGLGVAACLPSPHPAQRDDGAAIVEAQAAHRDYERGDCPAVEARASASAVDRWDPTESREAVRLLVGFCLEQAGEIEAAREAYRRIVREAPLSYASDDARERLRILRVRENDPDYAAWVDAARKRARSKGSSSRAPVARPPARFPPVAAAAGVEGFTVVEFGVTPRGITDAPVVVASEPPLLFDGAALRAVRSWRYEEDAGGTSSPRQAIRLVFRPGNPAVTTEGADEDARLQ